LILVISDYQKPLIQRFASILNISIVKVYKVQNTHQNNKNKAIMLCLGLFFLVAPTETALKTEQYYYIVCGVIAFIAWVNNGFRLRYDYTIAILLYLIYSLLSCFWSPNPEVSRYAIVKTVALVFLLITLQFKYSTYDYHRIKQYLVLQQIVLLAMFLRFGRIDWDGRLWIGSGGISTDPNSYTMWTILPLALLVEKLTSKEEKTIWKLFYLIALISSLYIVLLSSSRSGIIINLAAICICVLYRFKDYLRKSPGRSVLLLLIFIIMIIVVYVNIPDFVLRRFSAADTRELGGRTRIWGRFFSILNEHKWGYLVGLGEYSTVFYSPTGSVAHSVVIEILFSQGIIGLSFVLYYMFNAMRNVFKRDVYAGVGCLFTFIMSLTLSEFTSRPVMTAMFIGGMIILDNDD